MVSLVLLAVLALWYPLTAVSIFTALILTYVIKAGIGKLNRIKAERISKNALENALS